MPSSPAKKTERILSGVQPSGTLHLGNYFGAMQAHIERQYEGETFIFVADLHAMTTVQEPEKLREYTRNVVLDYLALGLDVEHVRFYRQSDIPEVNELAWIFACCTGMGLLERAHSYKDKVARGIVPSVGLFYYPVLMAADILLYHADVVPVGPDQKQHLEMTRDMARAFNERYGETFKLPREQHRSAKSVPGTDGQKMSKSYGNSIDIFGSEADLKRAVNKNIVTDSKGVDEPKNPDDCTVWQLYELVEPENAAAKRDEFAHGGIGYGHVKKWLLEALLERFGPARKKREELAADEGLVDRVLSRGAERVRPLALATIDDVRRRTGLRAP